MGLIKQVKLGTSDIYDIASKYIQAGNETKTWEDILGLISKGGRVVVLETLPQADADAYEEYKDALVLVPSSKEPNLKDEYVIIDNGADANLRYAWEKVGDTHIDLSGYVTKGTYSTVQNGAHTHTVTGNITVPTVEKTTKKMGATASGAAVGVKTKAEVLTGVKVSASDSVLGVNTTFNVGGGALTGATSASFTQGAKASWSAAVDTNGVLSFDFSANGDDIFETNQTGSISTITVTANKDDAVTAATGVSGDGTVEAATAVEVTAQPTITLNGNAAEGVNYVDGLTIGSTTTSLTNGATAEAGVHTHNITL